MILTISKKGQSNCKIKLSKKDMPEIKGHLKAYMKTRNITDCQFKLEGEAGLREKPELYCLFG